ncbi:MAG: SnoaL-like domain-containing protein [Gemmatimonadales bacterium]|nr:SnoaL-like domain-containing protein [Gemmatimonadales bacterium]
MRRIFLLLISAIGGACAPRDMALSTAHASAMADSVRTALAEFLRAGAAGQLDQMLAFYADDPGFRWVEDGAVKARSVEDIRRGLAGLQGMRVETTLEDTEVSPAVPGVASVATRFQTRVADSSGTKFSFGGAMTLVMVHRDGGWRILTGHSSSSSPAR